MRAARDANQTHHVIGAIASLLALADLNHFIADDTGPKICFGQLSGFDDVINTVVLQPTGVTALGIDDLIEKSVDRSC